jgi:hypothetical protein
MSGLLGTPFSSRNSFQLSPLIVLGRPPAGTKASSGEGKGGGEAKRTKGDGQKAEGEENRMGRICLILSYLIVSHESNQSCRQRERASERCALTCFDSEVHGVPSSQPFFCFHVHHHTLGRQLSLDTVVGEKYERHRERDRER